MALTKGSLRNGYVLGLLIWASFASAQTVPSQMLEKNGCSEKQAPGSHSPRPVDPYPLSAAGWGPEAENGLFISRWAEDWRCIRAAGVASSFKAMPFVSGPSVTLSAETRFRYVVYDNGQLQTGNDYQQAQFRSVLGADVRFNSNVRAYAEMATGQVDGRRSSVGANFQNQASLQQRFVDVREHIGSTLVGAMVGRQEFADGPRQLISLSDGPNVHRTWNGVRFYVHGQRLRFGAFDLRATRLERGSFDESINHAEQIRGINFSGAVSSTGSLNAYVDPFWIQSENPNFRSGGQMGRDNRDTLGLRFWGKQNNVKFDWTVAHQRGDYRDRSIDAWGVFAVQSVELSNAGWKPKLTAHLDMASGGGAYGSGPLKGFNPLYASSNYLGEGQFLSLSNVLMIAPGLSFELTPDTNVAVEYGFARRLDENDAVYSGGMRSYADTQNVPGHEIGGLFRLIGVWSACKHLTLSLNYEHFDTGAVLQRVGLPSGGYGYVSATFRY